ncbi:hypothetical protein TWF103_009381 [Orbilia oligospora]|nr:hypothetical protein TWF103_009381 [Orbilia oligospora]
MKKLESIPQLFFRHCPRDAITAVGYPIFHPFLKEDEQEDMISRLDVLLTDAHGWTVAAALHVMGNGRFKDLPMEYYEGGFTKQKVPGKLALRSDFRQPRAEDDLQFIMGSEDGYRTARKAAFGISPTEHDGKHIIGWGMNFLDRKIFFSVNGKMLPAWFSTSKSLQLPIITLHNCDMFLDEFLVNFERTEFFFEDANTPDWAWDGEVPEVDGIHLIHRPDQDGIIRDGRFILPRDY